MEFDAGKLNEYKPFGLRRALAFTQPERFCTVMLKKVAARACPYQISAYFISENLARHWGLATITGAAGLARQGNSDLSRINEIEIPGQPEARPIGGREAKKR